MIDNFLSYLQNQKKYSEHTIVAYRKDLEQFVAYLGSVSSVLEASHSDVRSWLLSLRKEGVGTATAHRKISSLKSFYKYLIKHQLMTNSPVEFISLPKKERQLPTFLKEIQTESLFKEISFPAGFVGNRDQVILKMFYLTGVRVSELVDLEERNIDFTKNTIKVLGKRNKERYIPVLSSFMSNIQEYITVRNAKVERTPFLFVTEKGKQMNRSQLYYIVKKYLSEVSTALKRSPHVLRHTFATQLLNNGADINALKELLGHGSLAATQLYTHITKEQLKKKYKQAHPRA